MMTDAMSALILVVVVVVVLGAQHRDHCGGCREEDEGHEQG